MDVVEYRVWIPTSNGFLKRLFYLQKHTRHNESYFDGGAACQLGVVDTGCCSAIGGKSLHGDMPANNGWSKLVIQESAACGKLPIWSWRTYSFINRLDLSIWNIGIGKEIADG